MARKNTIPAKDYIPARVEEAKAAYTSNLDEVANAYPDEYPWIKAGKTAAQVADLMFVSIKNNGIGSVGITNSKGWERTARQLKVKNTYGGWAAFFTS